MKTKVCPCCDQPIHGKYCRGCRKIVLHPVEQEIHYYLNERHPEQEVNCSYHGMTTEKRSFPEKKILENKPLETRPSSPLKQSVRKKETKQNPRVMRKVLIGLGVYLICSLGGTVFLAVQNLMGDFTFGTPEWNAEPVWEESIMEEELSNEEVKTIGLPCTAFGHFSTNGEALSPILQGCLEEGAFAWEKFESSYNERMDDWSWYNTTYEYWVMNPETEEYLGFINLECDTATGEFHGMNLYSDREDVFFEIADLAMDFLEKIEVASNLPDGKVFFEEAFEQQENGVVLQYGMEVISERAAVDSTIEETPTFYQMFIYAPGFYTSTED